MAFTKGSTGAGRRLRSDRRCLADPRRIADTPPCLAHTASECGGPFAFAAPLFFMLRQSRTIFIENLRRPPPPTYTEYDSGEDGLVFFEVGPIRTAAERCAFEENLIRITSFNLQEIPCRSLPSAFIYGYLRFRSLQKKRHRKGSRCPMEGGSHYLYPEVVGNATLPRLRLLQPLFQDTIMGCRCATSGRGAPIFPITGRLWFNRSLGFQRRRENGP